MLPGIGYDCITLDVVPEYLFTLVAGLTIEACRYLSGLDQIAPPLVRGIADIVPEMSCPLKFEKSARYCSACVSTPRGLFLRLSSMITELPI